MSTYTTTWLFFVALTVGEDSSNDRSEHDRACSKPISHGENHRDADHPSFLPNASCERHHAHNSFQKEIPNSLFKHPELAQLIPDSEAL